MWCSSGGMTKPDITSLYYGGIAVTQRISPPRASQKEATRAASQKDAAAAGDALAVVVAEAFVGVIAVEGAASGFIGASPKPADAAVTTFCCKNIYVKQYRDKKPGA